MATTSTAAPTKGEQTRDRILSSAIERFGRDGYRASSVADIARDAEVSGSLAYAYFSDKEDLFLAALDADTAAVIDAVRDRILAENRDDRWQAGVMRTLLDAVEVHPLARRVLAGLEPHVTGRVVQVPALDELRGDIATRMADDQAAGTIRPDIDPTSIANGTVTLWLAMLMAALQFGTEGLTTYGADVLEVFEAATQPIGSGT